MKTDTKLIEAVFFILKNPTWENRANLDILTMDVDLEWLAKEICYPIVSMYHKGQRFESDEVSTPLDYVNMHLAVVAQKVATFCKFNSSYDKLVTLCAAWLHDILEDTTMTLGILKEAFGEDVAYIVEKLTKGLNDHSTNIKLYSFVPAVAQIKLADISRNAETIEYSKSKIKAAAWAARKLEQIKHFYQPDPDFLKAVKFRLTVLLGANNE